MSRLSGSAGVVLLAALVLTAAPAWANATATNVGCNAPAGAERIWADPQRRILFVGEVHGTREIPAMAGALLCAAQQPGRPALLALEADPAINQAAVDAYLGSGGGADARAVLLAAPMWRDPYARGSEAVLDLVETARRLEARVVLFDPVVPAGATDGPREQAMAEALARAAVTGRVIALTGSGHADREGFTSLKLASAAQRLPSESFLSLAPLSAGGEAWTCQARNCAPRAVPDRGAGSAREIRLSTSIRAGFDGVYLVGGPFTAAPPAGAR